MSTASAPRPPALTLACVLLGAGSLVLLLELGSLLSGWPSLEVQEALRPVLAEEPLRSADISLAQALSWLRTALYVGVVLAVCGMVLAFFTARGDRGSRIALTVLCVLGAIAFAANGLVGLLPAAFALVCASTLWSPDSRRWFDARPAAAAADGAPERRGSTTDPFAARAPSAAAETTATAVAHQDARRPEAGTGAGAARPRSVQLATWTAIVCSAVVALLGLLTLLVTTLGADAYLQEAERQGVLQDLMRGSGFTAQELLRLTRLSSAAWLVLSVLCLAAAVLAQRRQRAGAVALLVLGALTVAVSLLFLPVGLVTAGAAIFTVVQLRRPEAQRWFTDPAERQAGQARE